jgi:hypothetical protein
MLIFIYEYMLLLPERQAGEHGDLLRNNAFSEIGEH